MGYAGHPQPKGAQARTSVANPGCVLGPMSSPPVHHPDTIMVPATLPALVDLPRRGGSELCGASCTLEAGFDSQDQKDAITAHKRKPVLSPNRRQTQTPSASARQCRGFARALYRLREKGERTFGWQAIYRKLAVSYDRLPAVRTGGRLWAYAMINFRVTFHTS